MKRVSILTIVVGLCLMLSLTTSAQADVKIGLSLPNYGQSFHVLLQESAQAAADEAGAELIVPETDALFDVAVELANVEELIAAGVDVIIIYPIDAVESVPAVQAASDAGIPVVLLEYGLAQAEDAMIEVATLVTADWEAVGIDAAAYLCEEIGGEGTILLTQSAGITAMAEDDSEDMMMVTYPSIDVVTAATTGMSTYFAESCTGAILVIEETETYTNEDSLTNFEAMLEANSRPVAIVISDADVAIDTINIIRGARLRGVTSVSLERSDDVLGAIQGGQLTLAIIPDPEQLGVSGVTAAVAVANGEEVDAVITVDSTRVDSDAAEQYRCPDPNGCSG